MQADRYCVRSGIAARTRPDPARPDRLRGLVHRTARASGLPLEQVFVTQRESSIDLVVLCTGTGCDRDILLRVVSLALAESPEFADFVITAEGPD